MVNYAQWESEEAIQGMMTNAESRDRMAAAWAISKPEVHRYTVSSIHLP